MNTMTLNPGRRGGVFAMLVALPLVLTACATGPVAPQGAADVRGKLVSLQNEPELAERARVEIRDAEEAVRLAEQPLSESESELGEHRVYLAEQKVAIARARATAKHAESERPRLAQERDGARLDARTREADKAHADASQANAAADRARSEQAVSAEEAERQARELQQQIDDLKAEATERGIVLTLGDVLFATNSDALQAGAGRNLDQLVDFLRKYSERTVEVEGHTDSTGSADYNRALSLRRADSVRDYLVGRGVAGNRLATAGIGEARPIADNNTSAGRQQNRRVEVIIAHPTQAHNTQGQ